MSAEVDWVLDQFGDVVGNISAPLKRVDRANAQVYEGSKSVSMSSPIRARTQDFKQANLVGAKIASRTHTPVGTEFDRQIETVVSVRVEGVHVDEFGHVDPDGSDGIPFGELVRRLKNSLETERVFPSVGRQDTDYYALFIENETTQSSGQADYYRTDFDVRFTGYEDLP